MYSDTAGKRIEWSNLTARQCLELIESFVSRVSTMAGANERTVERHEDRVVIHSPSGDITLRVLT
jgi:uncharacterized protein YheU (UPF0270 family)